MTPKEKAIELVHKYVSLTDGWVYGIASWEYKKKCALVAVDEMIKELVELSDGKFTFIHGATYYQEVKQEIEKL
jgi:hypothetical protein